MIVALKYISGQPTGGRMMSEVNTEEEAFAEMRRFLEVNNIPSDTTSSVTVEEHEEGGRTIPSHRAVRMYQSGYIPPYRREYPNPVFAIYYGSDRPRYERLGTPEDCGLYIKKDALTGEPIVENGHPVIMQKGRFDDTENKWYIPLLTYINDLEGRRGGDE